MLSFLHITKTGGCARRSALLPEMIAGKVVFNHQELRLGQLIYQKRVTPVVYLRDPYARFVSQWDSFGHTIRRNGPEYDYQDINAFADDMAYALKNASPRSRLMWEPQAWWANVERDDTIFLPLENMDYDFPRLLAEHSLAGELPPRDHRQAHPDSGVTHELSRTTMSIIEARYAEDFDLYARIPPHPEDRWVRP